MGKFTTKQLAISIMVVAFLLRLSHFFISLSYDEIWTIINFIQQPAGKLLFDLSLPNNHPLNSILVKWMYALPLDAKFIRVPSLLAGIISILLAGYLAKQLAGKTAALWGMLFTALNAPLIVYSTQARGYSLQVMLLLVFACALLKTVENYQAKRRFWIACFIMILSAAAAVMTLPTSVLYLAGTTLILWNYNGWKVVPKKIMYFLLLAVLVCSVYILLNLSDLLSARKWGDSFTGVPEYCRWLWGVLYAVVPWSLLPLSIYYLAKFRQYVYGYILLAGLLFVSAIFTHGGPGRVYLPLCVLFCITAGAGAAMIQEKIRRPRNRQLLLLAGIVLAASGYFYQIRIWSFTDYFPFIAQLKNFPPGVLIVYPAGDSYSMIWNSKGNAADFYTANFIRKNELQEMILLNSPGKINGIDKSYSEKTLPLTFDAPAENIAGVPAQRLKLKRFYGDDIPESRQPLLAVFSSGDKRTFKNYGKMILEQATDPDNVLHLNCWFSRHGENYTEKIYCGTWYIAPGAMSPESLKNIQKFAALYHLQN